MAQPDAASSAHQLLNQLEVSGRTVASFVIARHAAQIRILNPANDDVGPLRRWAEVSESFEPRSDVQWPDVAGSTTADRSEEPIMGSISVSVREALFSSLVDEDVDGICVAKWEGYADLDYPSEAAWMSLPPDRRSAVWTISAAQLLSLDRAPMRWWDPQLRWTVGNDIYARSVFVSGPETLMSQLLADPSIEASRVRPTDLVTPEDH